MELFFLAGAAFLTVDAFVFARDFFGDVGVVEGRVERVGVVAVSSVVFVVVRFDVRGEVAVLTGWPGLVTSPVRKRRLRRFR